eukprot:CAMPEP_0185463264 /NCGR_PEP_ID=MMETSP1365-20130426/94552_1 /TAXON_ID=38817 /ORGANISM="Gephyrocapsa oceanica, Strain RCC1303" /LENGTH=143 /DNA_ID=CAMNT_0028069991 /DNA_START=124 /DNA_END=552 /DNA_ORIENTATION=-
MSMKTRPTCSESDCFFVAAGAPQVISSTPSTPSSALAVAIVALGCPMADVHSPSSAFARDAELADMAVLGCCTSVKTCLHTSIITPFCRLGGHTQSYTTSAIPVCLHTTWKGMGTPKVRRVKLSTRAVNLPGRQLMFSQGWAS